MKSISISHLKHLLETEQLGGKEKGPSDHTFLFCTLDNEHPRVGEEANMGFATTFVHPN